MAKLFDRVAMDILRKHAYLFLVPMVGILLGAAVLHDITVWKLVLAIAVMVGSVYLVFKPESMFEIIALSIFLPLGVSIIGDRSVGLSELLIPFCFSVFMVGVLLHKTEFSTRWMSSLVKIYFLIGLVSFIMNPSLPGHILSSGRTSFRYYWQFFNQLWLYILVSSLFVNSRKVKSFLWIIGILSSFVIAFYCMALLGGVDVVGFLGAYRWRIHRSTANSELVRIGVLGTSGVLLFQVLIVFFERRRFIFLQVIGMVSCVYAVLVSGGRSSLLSLVFSFFVFLVAKRRYLEVACLSCCIIGFLVFQMFLGSIGGHLPVRFRRALSVIARPSGYVMDGVGSSSLERIEMWKAGLKNTLQNPVFGTGFKAVQYVKDSGRVIYTESSRVEAQVGHGRLHCAYISIASVFGLPALFIFLWIAYEHLKKVVWVYTNSNNEFWAKTNLLLLIIVCGKFLGFLFGGGASSIEYFFVLGMINGSWMSLRKMGGEEGGETLDDKSTCSGL